MGQVQVDFNSKHNFYAFPLNHINLRMSEQMQGKGEEARQWWHVPLFPAHMRILSLRTASSRTTMAMQRNSEKHLSLKR